jgi:protein SCO1/2
MIGLTGTPDQVEKICRAYRVYYNKANEEDEDYLLDHSIIIYLMDPNGEFVEFYGSLVDEKQMLERMKGQLISWTKKELGEDEEDKPFWKKFF